MFQSWQFVNNGTRFRKLKDSADPVEQLVQPGLFVARQTHSLSRRRPDVSKTRDGTTKRF
jgi:hypothetical protein